MTIPYTFSVSALDFFLIVIAAYAKITQIVIFSFPPIPPPSISLPSSHPLSSSFITKICFILLLHCTASYGLLVLLLVKNLKQVSSWHDFLLITCTKSQFMYLKKKIIIWFIGHKYGKIVKIHMMKNIFTHLGFF